MGIKIVINTIIIVVTIVILGFVGYTLVNKKISSDKTANENASTNAAAGDTPEGRDKIRKDDAATLATRLFVAAIINKQQFDVDEVGFTTFSQINNQEPLNDPLTKRPYVFSKIQKNMNVGEVTFGVRSSCDNKVSGSNGTGMIIYTGSRSVAVAMKLESGRYVCESSL